MHSPISRPGGESHPRSIVKAVSWRATGSVDTFLVSWLITGNPVFAGSIAATEIVTKIVLYYLHERAWGAVGWGRVYHGPPDVSRGSFHAE